MTRDPLVGNKVMFVQHYATTCSSAIASTINTYLNKIFRIRFLSSWGFLCGTARNFSDIDPVSYQILRTWWALIIPGNALLRRV